MEEWPFDEQFNHWWDTNDMTQVINPFNDDTPAYWAWEGWIAGRKAEREACAKVCENWTRTPETTGMELTLCAVAIRARGQHE